MSVKDSRTQSNKIIKEIGKLAKKVDRASSKLYDAAVSEIIKQNNNKPPFTARALVFHKINLDLKKILKKVNGDYDKFIKITKKYLKSNFEITLNKRDLKNILKKKGILNHGLVINTDRLKQEAEEILFSNLGKGVSERQLVRMLRDLFPNYSNYAETIVNTGMSRDFIDINVGKFHDKKFRWFLYAGPDDEVTRDFPCKHWVNHKFPMSQLDTVSAVRLGLWNCRHNIIPITNQEAKNYPELDLSFATK